MKILNKSWILFLVLVIGCSFNVNEIQSIDVEVFDDNDRNVKLAEELIYYDPRYIAHIVPSFNESTSKGIKLGYFVRSSDGKPSYRVTYSMTVPAVKNNLDTLKSDFEEFIPKLAKIHASKNTLFIELSPEGEAWVKKLFDGTMEDVLLNSSSLLRKSITTEQLALAKQNLSKEFGVPASIKFIRAQFYEEFNGIPESVSLYYEQTYKNGKKAFIRISFHQENGKWSVMGFRVDPYA